MWITSIATKKSCWTLQQCGIEQLQHCRSSANAPPTWIWCFLIPTLKTYMQKNVHVSTFRLFRGGGWLHWAICWWVVNGWTQDYLPPQVDNYLLHWDKRYVWPWRENWHAALKLNCISIFFFILCIGVLRNFWNFLKTARNVKFGLIRWVLFLYYYVLEEYSLKRLYTNGFHSYLFT